MCGVSRSSKGALVTPDQGRVALAEAFHGRNPDLIVLIQDFIQVPRPFAEVRAAFIADPRGLLDDHASAAYREGEQLSIRLNPLMRHKRFGKNVSIDLGEPYERVGRFVLPIQWWAPEATRFFPRLEADLELAPVGAGTTQITLMGRYDPPLAAVGRGADRMLLHHVAEACVRSFLGRIADSLASSVVRGVSPQEHVVSLAVESGGV